MFFPFAVSLFLLYLAVLNFVLGASFWPVAVLYFAAGLFWYRYESRRTKLCTLMIFVVMPQLRFLLFIAWPFFWVVRILDNIGRRRKRDRFVVLGDSSTPDGRVTFATWAEAVDCALEDAKRTGREVAIFDEAKFRYAKYHRFLGSPKELSHSMYHALPDGKIESCFSFWR